MKVEHIWLEKSKKRFKQLGNSLFGLHLDTLKCQSAANSFGVYIVVSPPNQERETKREIYHQQKN